MAQTLDKNGNVVVDGYSTNLSPSQYAQYSTKTSSSTTSYPTTTTMTPEAMTSPNYNFRTVPLPVDNTNHAATTSSIYDQVLADYNNANKKYTDAQTQAQKDRTDIANLMDSLSGKEAYSQSARDVAGVNVALGDLNKYTEQLAGLNASASALNREAQGIPLKTQSEAVGSGTTDRGLAPETTAQLRDNAIKALSIGQQADIASAALTGSQIRLKAAEDKAQQIIDLKYKPIEADLQARKDQYLLNKDALDELDKTRSEALAAKLKKEEEEIAAKKETDSKISSILLEAQKNGASPEITKAISESTTINDAIRAAGTSLATPETEVVKLGDSAAYLIDKRTGKVIRSFGGTTETGGTGTGVPTGTPVTTSALVNVGKNIGNFASVSAQKAFGETLVRLAGQKGGDQAIAEKIVGTAIDNITDSNDRKLVAGDFKMAQQLTRLQGLLDDYEAGGGQTGWITGKKEGGYQFTGKTSDVNLAKIGVQIANQLDELARTRTGAVVSSSEEEAFSKMLPSGGKSPTLNRALTSGLKTSLMSNVESSLRSSITSDGLNIVRSAMPEVFSDYRTANPIIQLKTIRSSSPQNQQIVDKIIADHPDWTAQDIVAVITGN